MTLRLLLILVLLTFLPGCKQGNEKAERILKRSQAIAVQSYDTVKETAAQSVKYLQGLGEVETYSNAAGQAAEQIKHLQNLNEKAVKVERAAEKAEATYEEVKETAANTARQAKEKAKDVARSMPHSQQEANDMVLRNGSGFFADLRAEMRAYTQSHQGMLSGRGPTGQKPHDKKRNKHSAMSNGK